MLSVLKKYGSDIEVKEMIDTLQTQLQCCGAFNYTDWSSITRNSGAEYVVSNSYSRPIFAMLILINTCYQKKSNEENWSGLIFLTK